MKFSRGFYILLGIVLVIIILVGYSGVEAQSYCTYTGSMLSNNMNIDVYDTTTSEIIAGGVVGWPFQVPDGHYITHVYYPYVKLIRSEITGAVISRFDAEAYGTWLDLRVDNDTCSFSLPDDRSIIDQLRQQ